MSKFVDGTIATVMLSLTACDESHITERYKYYRIDTNQEAIINDQENYTPGIIINWMDSIKRCTGDAVFSVNERYYLFNSCGDVESLNLVLLRDLEPVIEEIEVDEYCLQFRSIYGILRREDYPDLPCIE